LRDKRWVGVTTALLVALASPACSFYESMEPTPLEIRLIIYEPFFVDRDATATPPKVSCTYGVNARAVGGRLRDETLWVGGQSVWAFAGGAADTSNWSQTDVLNAFGFNLSAGEIATWQFRRQWLPAYTVTHRIRYRVPGGEEKTATVTFTCE
jgi:hypothetical protein